MLLRDHGDPGGTEMRQEMMRIANQLSTQMILAGIGLRQIEEDTADLPCDKERARRGQIYYRELLNLKTN